MFDRYCGLERPRTKSCGTMKWTKVQKLHKEAKEIATHSCTTQHPRKQYVCVSPSCSSRAGLEQLLHQWEDMILRRCRLCGFTATALRCDLTVMLDLFVILIEALAEFSCREAVKCKITTKHAGCITRHM